MGSKSLEILYEVWDDSHGTHFEIGPDRDGLDLIEIRFYEKISTKPDHYMVMDLEEAKLVVKALTMAIENFKKVDNNALLKR